MVPGDEHSFQGGEPKDDVGDTDSDDSECGLEERQGEGWSEEIVSDEELEELPEPDSEVEGTSFYYYQHRYWSLIACYQGNGPETSSSPEGAFALCSAHSLSRSSGPIMS